MNIHWKALRGALSDGTISFSIQPFSGENAFSEFFSKNSVLKELNWIEMAFLTHGGIQNSFEITSSANGTDTEFLRDYQ
jgi:hypothetical protein